MPVTSLLSASQGPTGQSFRQLEQGIPNTLEVRQSDANESPEPTKADPNKQGFLDLVKSFTEDVNAHQLNAGRAIDGFAAGEITDVHQVMVAVQEAGLALDLLLEIRNRTQEAFQEIMRIQV